MSGKAQRTSPQHSPSTAPQQSIDPSAAGSNAFMQWLMSQPPASGGSSAPAPPSALAAAAAAQPTTPAAPAAKGTAPVAPVVASTIWDKQGVHGVSEAPRPDGTKDDKPDLRPDLGKKTSVGATVAVKPHEGSATLTGGRESTVDGKKHASGGGVTGGYNSQTGVLKVGGTASVTVGENKRDLAPGLGGAETKRGAGLGVEVSGDNKGTRAAKVSGNVVHGQNKVGGSLGGGRTLRTEERTGADGKPYGVLIYSLKIEGGAGYDRETHGGGAGAGGAGSVARTRSGEKVFASLAQADAAKKKVEAGDLSPLGELGIPKAAAVLSSMKVGESRQVDTTAGASATASANAGVAKVTLAGGVTGSSQVGVKRTAENEVQVTLSSGHTLAGGGALGTAGAAAGHSTSAGKAHSFTVKIDLSTPEGKKAYAAAVGGATLDQLPKGGWTLVSKTKTTTDSSSTDVSIAGATIGQKSEVTQSVTTDAKGNKSKTDTGKHTDSAGAFLVGHHNTQDSIRITDANGHRSTALSSNVDSTDAASASQALAKATGTQAQKDVAGKASGKWSIGFTLDEKAVDKLVKRFQGLTKEQARMVSVTGGTTVNGSATGATEDVIKALQAAGTDKDKQRKALAKWVADGGDHAREQIKRFTGVDPDLHVGLEGDKHLTGIEGRVALDRRIAELRQKLANPATDKSALVDDIKSTLSAQMDKETALSDTRQYKELPSDLRATELGRTRGDITTLRGLLDRARKAAQKNTKDSATGKQGAPAADPAAQSKTNPKADPSLSDVLSGKDDDRHLRAQIATQQKVLARMKGHLESHQEELRITRQVHAYNPSPHRTSSKSMREELGAQGTLGIGRGSQYDAYNKADVARSEAMKALAAAKAAEKAHLDVEDPNGAAQRKGTLDSLRRVVALYRQADQAIQRANNLYKGIEQAAGKTWVRDDFNDKRMKKLGY